jgi:exopolyphosphatase/guanosine-5'-triphosphate,3'-diphosphate pyrophosphatase
MDEASVAVRAAIATSAARDASNREEFFDRAEEVLGVRPELISGEEEARLAYSGATAGLHLPEPVVVSDIGGGSTELATTDRWASVDIGSIRLTERCVPTRPAPAEELAQARAEVGRLFRSVAMPEPRTLIGIAGTWTSIAAIAMDLPDYDRAKVHGHKLSSNDVGRTVHQLSVLTIEETAEIPSLDPRRAPVILAGAIVAAVVCETTNASEVLISEHDTLDGVAMRLLALP